MPRDVEQALRGSLQDRAQDIRPDPATWERVTAGIRRRQRGRWALAGAAAAAAVVLAVLVTPTLLGSRIDLAPVPPADQPGLGAAVGAGGALVTDGEQLRVVGADGEVLYGLAPPERADEPLPFQRVAVRPGSTAGDVTAMYVRADADCERVELGWVGDPRSRPAGVRPGEAVAGGSLGGGQGFCITDPVWSPDGEHVAWVERRPGGRFTLQVLAWDDGGPASESATSVALDADGLDELRLTDWVVWGPDRQAAMYLTGVGGDSAQSFRLAIEHGDGVVEPQGRLSPSGSPNGADAEATEVLVRDPDGNPRTIVRLLAHPDGSARLAPSRGAPGELELPAAVLDAEDARSGEVWLAARGEDVLLGFHGRAWHIRRSGPEFTNPVGLAGTVVHADLLAADERPEPPEPEESPSRGGEPLVATDGQALTLHGPEGPTVLTRAEDSDVVDFAVHPTSSPNDLTVVWREGRDCDATLRFARLVGGEVDAGGTLTAATCPGRPVFAPDGTHLAWMFQPDLGDESADDSQDGLGLETTGWDGGPTGGLTTFELAADPTETMALDLHDWVWTDGQDADTAGTLHLAGYDGHGTVRAYTAPIERQADGALALPADATARAVTALGVDVESTAVLRVEGHHDGARVTYTLEQRGGQEVAIVRALDGEQAGEAVLPDDLLRVKTIGAEPQDRVWLTARGDTVLLGDGEGRAWQLRWSNAGAGDLQRLRGDVRFAVPLGTDPAPRQEEPEAVEPEGLPDPVADTRRAILEAARGEDVDTLAALTGPDFTSSFGGPQDPQAFFTRLRDDGELDRLVRILELPYAARDVEGTGTIYAWPAVFTVPPEAWREAEREQLRALGSQEDIDRWREFGGYIGWRVGIHADGTWRYYVAGD